MACRFLLFFTDAPVSVIIYHLSFLGGRTPGLLCTPILCYLSSGGTNVWSAVFSFFSLRHPRDFKSTITSNGNLMFGRIGLLKENYGGDLEAIVVARVKPVALRCTYVYARECDASDACCAAAEARAKRMHVRNKLSIFVFLFFPLGTSILRPEP